MYAILDT